MQGDRRHELEVPLHLGVHVRDQTIGFLCRDGLDVLDECRSQLAEQHLLGSGGHQWHRDLRLWPVAAGDPDEV